MQPELKIYKRNANVKGIAWGSELLVSIYN